MLNRFNAADTREASRRYRGDIFVATANQTLGVYLDFFAVNRHGKQVVLLRSHYD